MSDVFARFSVPEALEELRRRGICGDAVLLLDVLPLVEMAWADGRVQDAERRAVYAFLKGHLQRLAEDGCRLSEDEALRFADRWLDRQPTMQELRELRSLLKVVALNGDAARAHLVLYGAMQVGAAAAPTDGGGQSWDAREVQCMWELEDALKPRLE